MTSGRHPLARGYNIPRCHTCYLPLEGCICALTPTLRTAAQFWLLLHPDERTKPSNTARLIAAALPHTRLFLWQRTAPPDELLGLLHEPRFMPYLLCPQGDTELFTRLQERPWLPDRVPAFVLLDGTWSQVSKIFNKSPYLHGLPRLALAPQAPSAYVLRRQRQATHLSTVEAAIALLAQVEAPPCSDLLWAYFRVFTERCLAARHGHTVKKALPEMAQLLAYNHDTKEIGVYGTAPHPGGRLY